jgi:high-affinity iron transporter
VEPLFEGFAMVLAVAVLTSMLFWMMTAAKNIKAHVQVRLDSLLSQPQKIGLVVLSFIMVFREGVETALFMYGAGALTTPAASVIGAAIGLVIAGALGVGIVRASWRINLKRFFQVTGIVLVIIAAGLFANGIHELQEGFGWTLGSAVLYDWSAVLSDGEASLLGSLLHGIIGYRDAPTILEAVAYLAYWAFAVLLYLGIRTGRLNAVIALFRRPREQPAGTLKTETG